MELEESNETIQTQPATWVRFDENESSKPEPETFVTIPFDEKDKVQAETKIATIETEQSSVMVSSSQEVNNTSTTTTSETKKLNNGDVIVSIFPLNDCCDWITPAKFKANLVPEELMAEHLTLTVEEYVANMRMLINDYRFNCYIMFYKRVVALWAAVSVSLLLVMLFSGWVGVTLFIASMCWLLGNIASFMLVILCKKHLTKGLEDCIAQVNDNLCKHNILVGVDDAGNYSCHKINIVFIYFESEHCISFLEKNLKNKIQNTTRETNMFTMVKMAWDPAIHNIDTADIIITGSKGTNIPQQEKYFRRLYLQYSQSWARCLVRKMRNDPKNAPRGETVRQNAATTMTQANAFMKSYVCNPIHLEGLPRHSQACRCPCQYIEDILVTNARI